MNSFREKTILGFKWSLVSQGGSQLLTLFFSIILARLLSPNEFGLVGMVYVIYNFATILLNFGLGNAIIHKKEVSQQELSSIFWFNLLLGFIFTILLSACAGLVSRFYNESNLIDITIVLSFNFLITAINLIQQTLFIKRLNFKVIAIIDLSAIFLAGGVAIFLAYGGYGVWSLVTQFLLTSVIRCILLWFFSDWKPSFLFKWILVQGFFKYSVNLLATQIIHYWAKNIDKLLIGKFVGTHPLGIYNRSFTLMIWPLENIGQVMGKVMFPAFSQIQDNKEKVKLIYLKTARSIAIVTFPMMIGLWVVAEDFVLVLLGAQWLEMVEVLKILCCVGLIGSVVTINNTLYLSQGRTNLQLKVTLFQEFVTISSVIIGLRWGVYGVALGILASSLINLFTNLYFPGRLVNLSVRDQLKNVAVIFLHSLIMGSTVYFIDKIFGNQMSLIVRFIFNVSVGVIVYFVVLEITNNQTYQELKTLITKRGDG